MNLKIINFYLNNSNKYDDKQDLIFWNMGSPYIECKIGDQGWKPKNYFDLNSHNKNSVIYGYVEVKIDKDADLILFNNPFKRKVLSYRNDTFKTGTAQ
jgi:hypothetical protein